MKARLPNPPKTADDRALHDKYQALEKRYHELAGKIKADALDFYSWDTMVKSLDESWTYQIQNLEDLKQAANLQAYAEKEPFQAYIEMTAHAFDDMWKDIRIEYTKKMLPEMEKTVKLLAQQPEPEPPQTSSPNSEPALLKEPVSEDMRLVAEAELKTPTR